jgi:hypothetical protein
MRILEKAQTTVFFALVLTGLLVLTAVGIEIGRIVYARGEVGKAAALAAAVQVDVPYYRETGEIRFLPEVYNIALEYAMMNSVFLQRRNIDVAVTGIEVSSTTHIVSVTVTTDLTGLMPGFLAFQGRYSVMGNAEVRLIN